MTSFVRSKYIDGKQHKYEFFIEHIRPFIPYFYLANNANIYNVIFTDETEGDISALNNVLLTHHKNPEFQRTQLWFHGNREDHAEWCRLYSFQYKPIDETITNIRALAPYTPKVCAAPAWKYKDYCLLMDYYTDDTIQILRIEGLEHNWDIFPYLPPSTYLFITIGCMFAKWNFEFARNTLFTQNPSLPLDHIVWEAPDLDVMLWATEYGFPYIFCNHNCWLDFTKFKIKPLEKKYNMVMNCRPEREFKRPYLARTVPNLAYIKGHIFKKSDTYDYSELQCKYINKTRIPPEEVVNIYNESYCGGIFSAAEGACYSSSEYLLSGLPVISTVGRGGRDTWYNKHNSLIVEPDEESVKQAVELWIDKQMKGEVNPVAIREEHIQVSQQMRSNFNRAVQDIFDTHGIHRNAYDYFSKKYTHKFKDNLPLDVAIRIIKERCNSFI